MAVVKIVTRLVSNMRRRRPQGATLSAAFWDVTVAAGVPSVGVGGGMLSSPFMDSASSDNCDKPTDGGVARNTLYTFFCERHTHR